MSNSNNDLILERASEMVEYWDGTLHSKLILKALDSNDLEDVLYRTVQAEAEASRQEIYGYDVLPRNEEI